MSESRKKRFGEWVNGCLGSALRRRDRFWEELFAAWFSNKADNGRQPSHTRFADPFTPLAARALSNGELIKGFELDNGHVFLDFNGGFPFRVFRLGL